ncbi:GNAT family N-acetyltransferase [Microcella daejeonensis]|uniref:GNAT family N-acetyltransferase n=1 Tax=Microcella daejeonensis TaxID=2994971 RepID=UPI00226E2CFB|nr:GNAT family N-acetyltransferase [Microcella daejeonensis]WAB84474.1 GNAT family N-acetyltransferase [Microcella daejeonensis]
MTSSRLAELWPAAGLRVRAGDLELRWIDDELALDLAELAGAGIHDEGAMPFNHPWTRGPARAVARSVLTFQWAARSQVGPDRLVLELGVLVDGRPVGVQSASGDHWSVLRELETGSWLGRAHQGQGIGTRMRALMLHLCFEGLGAESVVSGAFTDNDASTSVSRRTGFETDGVTRVVREGAAAMQTRYRMDRARWRQCRDADHAIIGADIVMEGVDALLADLASPADLPGAPPPQADPAP